MEALNALWEHGPGSYRQVHEVLANKGRTWAATTVQTLLQRLQAKGFVERTLEGGTSIFRATESKERFLQHSLDTLSADVGGPMPVVLNLIKGTRFTPDQIAELQALLEARQAESSVRRKKKPGRRS